VIAEGSVSQWISQLRAGEDEALAKLHRRYWPVLLRLARRKLQVLPNRAADEEDVAQEAFWGFYRSFKRGRLPVLRNRTDLLALLTIITARKAATLIERETARKRGGSIAPAHATPLDQLQDSDPTPQQEALLHDCYEQYMSRLPENLRPFAERFLSGLTYREIAQQMNCSERTVERKIPLVLELWQNMAADSLNEA
jgi:RNA polymerase sigma factor (sigma-70 family)